MEKAKARKWPLTSILILTYSDLSLNVSVLSMSSIICYFTDPIPVLSFPSKYKINHFESCSDEISYFPIKYSWRLSWKISISGNILLCFSKIWPGGLWTEATKRWSPDESCGLLYCFPCFPQCFSFISLSNASCQGWFLEIRGETVFGKCIPIYNCEVQV